MVLARAATKLAPENPQYRDTLAWAYFKNQMYEEAKEAMEEAMRLAADTELGDYERYYEALLDSIQGAEDP